jgi:hypothetical protein
MNQPECKITVSEEDGFIIVNYWDSRASKVGDYRHAKDELCIKTIERISHWAAEYDTNCSEDDLKLLGLHLYYLLFNEEIRNNLEKSISKSDSKDTNIKLRLILMFEKSAEVLSQYPWEFLFLPEKPNSFEGKFLARKTELIFARYLPESDTLDKLAPEPADLPIRILIVSSSPRRSGGSLLDPIEKDRVVQNLMKFKSDKIKVEHLVDPNYDKLKKFIKGSDEQPSFTPHILHFIGHGEAGKIALKKTREEIIKDSGSSIDFDSADDAQWITKSHISSLFDDVPKPKFVFLNACNAAKTEIKGYNDFSNNLALELVNLGVPAVLAMQYKITNNDAADFSERVYLDIARGAPIDQAVKNGIRTLGDRTPAWNHPRFGIPVFYLGARDTTFFAGTGTYDLQQDKGKPLQIECPTCSKKFASRFDECPYCNQPYKLCTNCEEPLPVESVKCPVCKTQQRAGQDMFGKEKRINIAASDEKIPLSYSSVDAGASNPEVNTLSQNINTLQATKPKSNN